MHSCCSLSCCSGSHRVHFSGVYHSWMASSPPPLLTSPETHTLIKNVLTAACLFFPTRLHDDIEIVFEHCGILFICESDGLYIWQELSQEEHFCLALHFVCLLFTGLNQNIVLGLFSPASLSSCITSSPNMDERQASLELPQLETCV